MVKFDFSGKKVLVTGGSQGIGFAIAQAFVNAGASVHISGTRELASEYEDDLSLFTYHQVKLEDKQQRDKLVEAVQDIDILINNAGMVGNDEYEFNAYMQTMEVNLNAAVDLAYQFHSVLSDNKGNIVNLGSVASFISLKHVPAYTVSKAGLLGFTRVAADQWAYNGIRVNMVAPGFVDTKMTAWAKEMDDEGAAVKRAIPAKRWGKPEEVASAVLFLASDSAAYITGQSLIIDGGLLLR